MSRASGRSIFSPTDSFERLHPSFGSLARARGREPARVSLQSAYDLLPKPDGNFIKDFQTTGFDARVWELYLAAYAQSVGMHISQPGDRPDFCLENHGERVWVEAVTANPTQPGGSSIDSEDYWERHEAVAIKFGSPLWSKLAKRYWELPHVQGTPLVLALADFHEPDPSRQWSGPLELYLYGNHVQLTSGPGEQVAYRLRELTTLESGPKSIPAGFFKQPETENISAVLFSNAGTVAKFSRMGFDSVRYPHIRMLRYGFRFDPGPSAILPAPFAYIVGEQHEDWGQGVAVFHNPNAKWPIPKEFFGAAYQFWMIDGGSWWDGPDFQPLGSITNIFVAQPSRMIEVESRLRATGEQWVKTVNDRIPQLERTFVETHRKWNASRANG